MSELKRTTYFLLELVPVKDTTGTEYPGYRISNTETGVTELETFMLVEAIAYLDQSEHIAADFFGEREVAKAEILHS